MINWFYFARNVLCAISISPNIKTNNRFQIKWQTSINPFSLLVSIYFWLCALNCCLVYRNKERRVNYAVYAINKPDEINTVSLFFQTNSSRFSLLACEDKSRVCINYWSQPIPFYLSFRFVGINLASFKSNIRLVTTNHIIVVKQIFISFFAF